MDAQSCFRSLYADFQRQLNPADISAYLYSAGLITETELEDVDNRMHSVPVRASEMLRAVGRAINSNSGNFLKFLDILERVDRYKVIAQKAREMLGQQSSSPQYPPQMVPKDPEISDAAPSSLTDMCGCGKCDLRTIIKYGCSTPRQNSKFPYLNIAGLPDSQTSLIISRLSDDFEVLICKYDTLILKFEEWVKQNIDLKEYKYVLLKLKGVISPQKDGRSFADMELEINCAMTHDELSIIVTKYVNWFQYNLLQRIVQNACENYKKSKQGFSNYVDLYEKELIAYCKRNIFECPMPSSFPIQPGAKYLRLKLDKRFEPEKVAANEILRFQGTLIQILDIYQDTLEIKCITKGCIELISSIPSSVHSSIFPLHEATLKELTLLGVIEIDTEGYQAVISKELPCLLRRILPLSAATPSQDGGIEKAKNELQEMVQKQPGHPVPRYDLVTQLGLPVKKLPLPPVSEVKIPDADIARVAGIVPNWQIVAKKLGFGGQDIEDIETSHRASADQRKAFLRKWIWKNGTKATYEKLCTALEELGEHGAAESIRELPQ